MKNRIVTLLLIGSLALLTIGGIVTANQSARPNGDGHNDVAGITHGQLDMQNDNHDDSHGDDQESQANDNDDNANDNGNDDGENDNGSSPFDFHPELHPGLVGGTPTPTLPPTLPPAGTTLTASLSGAAEVPGPGDPDASGSASVELADSGQVCFDIMVANVGAITGAHIHLGSASEAGPIVVDFNVSVNGLSGCVSADSSVIAAILANPSGYYVNVHNAEYPDGAARGQLAAVVTPTATPTDEPTAVPTDMPTPMP